jgi:four helix bundle protein
VNKITANPSNTREDHVFIKTQNLWIVRLAEKQCDRVHKLVDSWGYFEKKNIGQQIQRSSDSIGANIVEGCGRQHPKDALNFLFMARASLDETIFWIHRASQRYLISSAETHSLLNAYTKLSIGLAAFIQYRKNRIQQPAVRS